jgi:prolyl 4-hydroxylase
LTIFAQQVRNSSRAMLPRTNTVQCVEKRALDFQGRPSDVFIERVWAQKYQTGGHYTYHFDYSGSLKTRGAGRISTFMVYVDCQGCFGGGTEFPRLTRPKGQHWCDIIECPSEQGEDEGNEKEKEKGVVFKPMPGSAVYWENFDSNGNGWDELWHSGMQVEQGIKIGLNIWSWYQPGYAEYLATKKAGAKRAEL